MVSRSSIATYRTTWIGLVGASVIAAVAIVTSSQKDHSASGPLARRGSVRSTRQRPDMANSENWVSGLLASPADANFHERYQMLSGSKSFEQLLSDIHLVNTGVLLKWLDRLDTSSTGETDSSLELVVSACLIDLARRNQPEVTHLFVKLRKFCIEPDAFRSIAENLVLIDPSQTAALIDQSKRENIKGIGSGCGSGLLAYLRASGDLEATLKNSEY
ncbi:MAG: hypothetical protein WCK77_25390, partial [Verrucomicrobiota bacterium]